jgi:hypothetical protein
MVPVYATPKIARSVPRRFSIWLVSSVALTAGTNLKNSMKPTKKSQLWEDKITLIAILETSNDQLIPEDAVLTLAVNKYQLRSI